MKNIFGTQENLTLYHKNGEIAYFFVVGSNYYWEATYDNQGRLTSYKNSLGKHWKRIYKENGTYEQIDL